jgi:hypothetical protein
MNKLPQAILVASLVFKGASNGLTGDRRACAGEAGRQLFEREGQGWIGFDGVTIV